MSLPSSAAICRRCGASNAPEAEFCGNCGTKLSDARFALAPDAVSQWRRILGGLEGWSPTFTPKAGTLALWAKLNPPLIPEKESFIFCVTIPIPLVLFGNPSGDFKVTSVTMEGTELRSGRGFTKPKWVNLLATESRLVAYQLAKGIALQVPYDQIVSLNVDNDRYTLRLLDGSTAEIQAKSSRPGLLAVAAVMGAPPEAKGHIVSMEKAKAERAQTFEATFTQFLMEIIEENKRRGGLKQ